MHFFIIPTTSCNSTCKYCYGTNATNKVMEQSLFRNAIKVFYNLTTECNGTKTELSFHGGEPLLAGANFYEKALPIVNDIFGNTVKIGIQSNLWNINDEVCELFKQYNIRVGSSLDGPEEINDFQRSKYYFKKTITGIEKLRKHGISSGCIATFTTYSASRCKEVFNFFLKNNMHFEIHSAIKPFNFKRDVRLFLSPTEFGKLLIILLELYLQNIDKIKISTLDTFIKNISNDKSGLCTFTKCLGNYLAVDPKGDLYTCNRFVGNSNFSVGNVNSVTSWKDIKQSEAWQKFEAWQNKIDKECADCIHKNICHGGCMYSGFASGNGKPYKDANCEAYKMIYDYILDKGIDEFFSNENMKAIKTSGEKSSLFRRGPLLQIMYNDPHPYDISQISKRIVASVLLGITNNPKKVTEILFSLNIVKSQENASVVIDKLHKELSNPVGDFINIYIHITGKCNLNCSHCYAFSNKEFKATQLPINIIIKTIEDAVQLGFRKIIITGGEPLLHPDFSHLLDFIIASKRQDQYPKIVLRTNLSLNIDNEILDKMISAFDQIAVSLDGTETVHDKRRGKGTYNETIKNLNRFGKDIRREKISISTVIDYQNLSEEKIENEKKHILKLQEKYEFSDIRFTPILPLGRAVDSNYKKSKAENIGVINWIKKKYSPRSSCGIGYNLMIDSDGSVYPCHVYKKDNYYIDNIADRHLVDIVKKQIFINLKKINVNTIKKCSKCNLRYLCGGMCSAWQHEECKDLYQRAKKLFLEALEILKVPIETINELDLNFKPNAVKNEVS